MQGKKKKTFCQSMFARKKTLAFHSCEHSSSEQLDSRTRKKEKKDQNKDFPKKKNKNKIAYGKNSIVAEHQITMPWRHSGGGPSMAYGLPQHVFPHGWNGAQRRRATPGRWMTTSPFKFKRLCPGRTLLILTSWACCVVRMRLATRRMEVGRNDAPPSDTSCPTSR